MTRTTLTNIDPRFIRPTAPSIFDRALLEALTASMQADGWKGVARDARTIWALRGPFNVSV